MKLTQLSSDLISQLSKPNPPTMLNTTLLILTLILILAALIGSQWTSILPLLTTTQALLSALITLIVLVRIWKCLSPNPNYWTTSQIHVPRLIALTILILSFLLLSQYTNTMSLFTAIQTLLSIIITLIALTGTWKHTHPKPNTWIIPQALTNVPQLVAFELFFLILILMPLLVGKYS